MMPVPLSYFSPLVGGLPGATALGMEPTYYWDALSPEARRWLAEHTEPPDEPSSSRRSPTRGSICARRRTAQPSGPDRSRPTEMVRAPKPAGGLFGRRPGARRAWPAGLHSHQAGRPLDLDLSLQRGRARERPVPTDETGTFRSGAQRHARRPTGLLRNQIDPHDHARRINAIMQDR